MPPRRVPKASKAKVVNNVPSDPQERLPAPAAPVPALGQPRRTHSSVPVSSMSFNTEGYSSDDYKLVYNGQSCQ